MPHRGPGVRVHPEVVAEEPEKALYPQNQHLNVEERDPSVAKCCVPTGCIASSARIHMDHLNDCLKVICNNEHCQEGRYMHKQCFEQWEETVLTYLRSTGRARSWSEKQRLQNLWTKKGYDLAYKACGCRCGKGHLKKDLDWIPPPTTVVEDQAQKRRKNRKKKGNDKPTLIISTTVNPANGTKHGLSAVGLLNGSNGASQVNCKAIAVNCNTGSISGVFPLARLRTSSMSSNGSAGSGGTSPPICGSESQSPTGELHNTFFRKLFFGDNTRRERHGSGSIFSRRQDYSSFNTLPRNKINSYHIKMEDDGNHGNDETRCFILSTLSANRVNRSNCMVCQAAMLIFDRYPLIDGSFFLSPRQYGKSALPVHLDGRPQYLNAICMGCLEGWNVSLRCRSCATKWNGSHLILGSMYSYDIFAAVPCCADRLRCNNCQHLVIPPERRLEFFSDYSHSTPCAHCGIVENHFVKPLQVTFRAERE